ncbi:SRPBCC family protein [Fodinibius halophilus]|uniref:SRPBCC family protein n=1 Tax=Fodinibius halophilus TaxID=1736908 RepID=A0A6M1SYP5_9BACT|nr:SRPBCC family protein [Fodinibius halophilus]NGP88456.1 SRPBCC family protein [Fodinibius halophilus]
MKYFLIILGTLAGIPLIVYGIGSFLPQSHTVSHQQTFEVPQQQVWQLITDVKSYPDWRPYVDSVKVLSDSTEALRWREYYREAESLPFVVTASNDSSKLVTKITDSDLPFGGTWTYAIDSTAEGTQLTITENGEIYSPIYRFISTVFVGHDTTIKQYFKDLERRLKYTNH